MKNITIGIDIGGTNTVIGVVDQNGMIIDKKNLLTKNYPLLDSFITALHDTIEDLIQKNNLFIKAIGIGAPDANYYRGTIEHAPNLAWKGIVPLCDLLKKFYSIPVVITNDANAAALGEMVYGGAKNMKHFALITLGTGLGSGIVVDGNMVYGATGFAGELGHTIIEYNGRDCGCGRKGCLECYVSATGICRTVSELLGKRKNASKLRSISYENLDSSIIASAANDGDKIALEAFTISAKHLAFSLVNLIALLSPEAIFISGGLAGAGDVFFKPLRQYVEENIEILFKNSVKIIPSEIDGKDAAILGASALAWKEIE